MYMVTYEDVCEDEFTLKWCQCRRASRTNLPLDTVACNGNAVELNSGPWPW